MSTVIHTLTRSCVVCTRASFARSRNRANRHRQSMDNHARILSSPKAKSEPDKKAHLTHQFALRAFGENPLRAHCRNGYGQTGRALRRTTGEQKTRIATGSAALHSAKEGS